MTKPKRLALSLLCAALASCAIHEPPLQKYTEVVINQAPESPTVPVAPAVLSPTVEAPSPSAIAAREVSQSITAPAPMLITETRQTGQVENKSLSEISGLVASRRTPGMLFALNDSGNSPMLFAISETGRDLGQWRVNARNRDWEELASVQLDGKPYLIIGDTGDNRQSRSESTLYFLEEPSLQTSTVLEPERTLRFRYEDGPRNVEALAVNDGTIYLISKEPIGPDGPQASRLYTLTLPDQQADELLVATFAGKLPLAKAGLEVRLAAAVAAVDLNHPTALDFDYASNTAYLLTYRRVLRIRKRDEQTWIEALTTSAESIFSHPLRQAEAIAVVSGQSIWLTSEHAAAPIWALPILPPS